jgi:hypothetical protein
MEKNNRGRVETINVINIAKWMSWHMNKKNRAFEKTK